MWQCVISVSVLVVFLCVVNSNPVDKPINGQFNDRTGIRNAQSYDQFGPASEKLSLDQMTEEPLRKRQSDVGVGTEERVQEEPIKKEERKYTSLDRQHHNTSSSTESSNNSNNNRNRNSNSDSTSESTTNSNSDSTIKSNSDSAIKSNSDSNIDSNSDSNTNSNSNNNSNIDSNNNIESTTFSNNNNNSNSNSSSIENSSTDSSTAKGNSPSHLPNIKIALLLWVVQRLVQFG